VTKRVNTSCIVYPRLVQHADDFGAAHRDRTLRPGTDFMNLHFGPKKIDKFLLSIFDKNPPKYVHQI
jgi:hypothetical protein